MNESGLANELYLVAGELGSLLVEAHADVPHAPETIRGAVEHADEVRRRCAAAHGCRGGRWLMRWRTTARGRRHDFA